MAHQLFFWGGTSGGLGVLLLIATTAIAVLVYFARRPSDENLWRRTIAPSLAALALLLVSALALANFATLLGVPEDSPLRWGVPITYLIIAMAGIGWGLMLRTSRPEVYNAIGLGAKTAANDAGLDDRA